MDSGRAAIRIATLADSRKLAEIEKASFAEGYSEYLLSEEDFCSLIVSPEEVLFCYTSEAEVIGYAHLELGPDRSSADFDSLAVSPDAQGRGVGEALFKHVEEYCRSNSISILNLRIKENNYRLLQRYHRFGYKLFEIVLDYYEDGWSALRMSKKFR